MRPISALLCLGLFACQSDQEFHFLSTIETRTDGVAISEDGLVTVAAMQGTTCTLDARWGCPTSDEDLPSDGERVLDHYAGETLAQSGHTLHFMKDHHWIPGDDLEIDGLKTARLTDDGLWALRGDTDGCALETPEDSTPVDSVLCDADASFEVDRRGGLIAVTGAGVYRADRVGSIKIADQANLASIDIATDLLYVANRGLREIAAVDISGEETWVAAADGAISDIAARGDKGDVVVLAETDDGYGVLQRIDGRTGKVRSRARVPSGEGDLVVSGNGRILAIVTDDAVHHFEMAVGAEVPTVADEVTACMDMPTRNSSGTLFD